MELAIADADSWMSLVADVENNTRHFRSRLRGTIGWLKTSEFSPGRKWRWLWNPAIVDLKLLDKVQQQIESGNCRRSTAVYRMQTPRSQSAGELIQQ